MKATQLLDSRIVYAEEMFAELVIWQLQEPVAGATHQYKYRLAYVVRGECVLRYDNEAGKGDHRHFGNDQSQYVFRSVDRLVDDFLDDVERWRNENRNP